MNAIVAVTAAAVFGVFYWQKLWPKVQCWLLVAVGWGLGGMLGSWLQELVAQASNLSSTATSLLFGVGVPSVIALVAVLIFVLDMLPNSKVSTKPVGWHTRICALLVPLSIAMLPALGSNISAAIGM